VFVLKKAWGFSGGVHKGNKSTVASKGSRRAGRHYGGKPAKEGLSRPRCVKGVRAKARPYGKGESSAHQEGLIPASGK